MRSVLCIALAALAPAVATAAATSAVLPAWACTHADAVYADAFDASQPIVPHDPSGGAGGAYPGKLTRTLHIAGLGSGMQDYYVYIPTSYTPGRPTPLMLALHGAAPYGSAGSYAATIRDNWSGVAELTVREIERRSLLGDMAGAERLAEALAGTAGGPPGPLHDKANAALDTLAQGSLARHVITQFRKASDAEAQSLTRMCQAIGPRLVLPFAEALSTEDHTHTIRRIRELLISFGAEGRRAVEPLKNSTKPAVRRTAVDLLRVFGGNEALVELTPLLDDADPQVQRDAVRAIAQIGTPEAYAVVDRACAANDAARELIVRELIGLRDPRAVPSLAGVLKGTAPRGTMAALHESIIDALAGLGAHADSTAALRTALDRGDWWAPRRTSVLRKAAATALKRIGSPETMEALEEAVRSGSRGVRAAARLALGREGAVR